jgi:hypothetical protein
MNKKLKQEQLQQQLLEKEKEKEKERERLERLEQQRQQEEQEQREQEQLRLEEKQKLELEQQAQKQELHSLFELQKQDNSKENKLLLTNEDIKHEYEGIHSIETINTKLPESAITVSNHGINNFDIIKQSQPISLFNTNQGTIKLEQQQPQMQQTPSVLSSKIKNIAPAANESQTNRSNTVAAYLSSVEIQNSTNNSNYLQQMPTSLVSQSQLHQSFVQQPQQQPQISSLSDLFQTVSSQSQQYTQSQQQGIASPLRQLPTAINAQSSIASANISPSIQLNTFTTNVSSANKTSTVTALKPTNFVHAANVINLPPSTPTLQSRNLLPTSLSSLSSLSSDSMSFGSLASSGNPTSLISSPISLASPLVSTTVSNSSLNFSSTPSSLLFNSNSNPYNHLPLSSPSTSASASTSASQGLSFNMDVNRRAQPLLFNQSTMPQQQQQAPSLQQQSLSLTVIIL